MPWKPIRFSLATHRGCYGECNFCAIAVHQGRTIVQRSRKSIVNEAKGLIAHPAFKGRIHDVGGPTANMYGVECRKKLNKGSCSDKRCLFPQKCKAMQVDHSEQLRLLEELRQLQGVKQVVVSSGIRYDLILADQKNGLKYLRQVVRHHVSGQMKVAPEHCQDNVLACMGKPGRESLLRFRDLFNRMSAAGGTQAVPHLLHHCGPSRLSPAGYAGHEEFRPKGAEGASPAGADLHAYALNLVHPYVLDRRESFYWPALFCRTRMPRHGNGKRQC